MIATTCAGNDWAQLAFGYNRFSNRLYRANLTAQALGKPFDELYAYDRVNRLVDFKRGTLSGDKKSLTGTPTKAQSWALDQTGNWPRFTSQTDGVTEVDQTRVHNAVNEITALSAWFPTQYDHAGNMTRMPKPAEPTAGFAATYDAWNRLVKLREVDDCGCPAATVQENSYDAQTWRTVRKDYTGGSLSETRHFYYSAAWQCLEERLGSTTTPNRQHIWGLRYIDDLILRDRDTDGNGTLDERLFPTQDANWNVTSVVTVIGTTEERCVYEAYGVVTSTTSVYDSRATTLFDVEYSFSSRSVDQETQLICYRARIYNPRIGRFLVRDRSGLEESTNRYAYVSNQPTAAVDPSGRRLHFSEAAFAGTTDELELIKPHFMAIKSQLNVICPEADLYFSAGTHSSRLRGELVIRNQDPPCTCMNTQHIKGCQCLCELVNSDYLYDVRLTAGIAEESISDYYTGRAQSRLIFPHNIPVGDPLLKKRFIFLPVEGRARQQYGNYTTSGTVRRVPYWRVTAHELCGHAWREHHQNERNRGILTEPQISGRRPTHDVAVGTENAIAAEADPLGEGRFIRP